MKAVVAILFSLLLVLNPPVLSAAITTCQSAAGCACSSCDTAKCCLQKSLPAPPLPPAATAPAAPDTLQLLAAAVTQWVTLPAPLTVKASIVFFSSPKLVAVPLYEWNCSYLI